MVREVWQSLNGRWDYAITRSYFEPSEYEGEIIVPFSPETELSGVGRAPGEDEYIWYRRMVTIPDSFDAKRVLLHFGAVDQEADVWINARHAARHLGGYTPFDADMGICHGGDRIKLTVRVRDITDRGSNTRGKQRTKRGGIWYTPQSGIWQSVWMEPVGESYVKVLRITPDFDRGCVSIWADTAGEEPAFAEFRGDSYALPCDIPVPDFEPWSPENPKLYDFSVRCGDDRVRSYFAMRKFSVAKDKEGVMRLFLNGEPYFHNGVLDQGYWPDGLYTAPCDEAMICDIETVKRMGFNMLRKHIKVEPLRWYYHCDRLGMLVWQDMPCGGGEYSPLVVTAPLFTGIHLKDTGYGIFDRADKAGREQFERELDEMIAHLYNCPCIDMWVPFNEGWGQFDAKRICDHVRSLDPSRTVDHASGWHDQGAGEVRSDHVYFRPYRFKADRLGRAVLLSEFGGYVYQVENHRFNEKSFGYKKASDPETLREQLTRLYSGQIAPALMKGLSAAVYTQLSDVEDELNGLMTYDRQVVKLPEEVMREIVTL